MYKLAALRASASRSYACSYKQIRATDKEMLQKIGSYPLALIAEYTMEQGIPK